MAWLSGWQNRKQLRIDDSQIGTTLTDFPVLVTLDSTSNFDFAKAESDGVDIRFTTDDETTLLKYEREFHGDVSTYGTDILTGGTASGDTNGGAWGSPGNAVDNNEGTFGSSSDSIVDHWWKYDLGSGVTKTVQKVRIKPYNNAWGNSLKDFKIQGSNDDSIWDDLFTGQHKDSSNWQAFEFVNTAAYRYYRIYMTSNWMVGHGLFGLWEVEMMEVSATTQKAYYWVKVPSIIKRNDGSVELTGGQYLSIPDSDDWAFGSNDFTVDFLVKFNSLPASGSYVGLFDQFYTSRSWAIAYRQSYGLYFNWSTDGSSVSGTYQSWSPTTDTWYHIACVRTTTSIKLFIDGIQLGSDISIGSDSIFNSTTPQLYIGASHIGNTTPGNPLNGSLDEVRISKGIARWTSDFTPSTSEYTSDSNTQLLLHFHDDLADSGNTGHTVSSPLSTPNYNTGVFYDAYANDNYIYLYYGNNSVGDGADPTNVWDSYYRGVWHLSEEGYGVIGEYLDSTSNNNDGQGNTPPDSTTDAIIYKAQDFTATANSIQIPDSSTLELGSSDFSISFKLKTDGGGSYGFLTRWTSVSSYFYLAVESANLRFRDYGGGGQDFSRPHGFSIGVWYDIEVTREGSVYRLYKNGTQLGAHYTNANTLLDRLEGWKFGGEPNLYDAFDGKLDEVRFSIGTARNSAWRSTRLASDNNTLLSFGVEEAVSVNQTIDSDSKVILRSDSTLDSNGFIILQNSQTIQSNSLIKQEGLVETLTSEGKVILQSIETLNAEGYIVNRLSNSILSNANIQNIVLQTLDSTGKVVLQNTEVLTGDTVVLQRVQESILSEGIVLQTESNTINSDSDIKVRLLEDIQSDATCLQVETLTIESDSKVIARVTQDISSNSVMRGAKYFFTQAKAVATSLKDFNLQLQVSQSVPLDPTGVSVTDLETGDSVSITWTDSGNYGYLVYKDVGGSWELVVPAVLFQTSLVIGTLVTNVTYTFKIVGVNGIGTESPGVIVSGTPTFNINRYKSAIYSVVINGVPQTDAVLSSVDLVYGPSFSTANFFIPKRPNTVTLNPVRQVVTVYINNRLVFTGYLVRREDRWSGQDIRVSYVAVGKVWEYTWTTPEENYNSPKGGVQPTTSTTNILNLVGAPTRGLPSKRIYSEMVVADMTTLDIMEYMTRFIGHYKIYCSPSGEVSFYKMGSPLQHRTLNIGQHIIEETLTTDITDRVDKVTVYSGDKQITSYREYTMGDILVQYPESDRYDDTASDFFYNHISTFFDRSGQTVDDQIEDLFWGLDNPYSYTTQPRYVRDRNGNTYIIFEVRLLYTSQSNLSNVQVFAKTNQDAQLVESQYFGTNEFQLVTGGMDHFSPTVPIEIMPSHVNLETWSDGTTTAKVAVKKYKTFQPSWESTSARVTYSSDGRSAYIVLDSIPVRYSHNVREKVANFTASDGEETSLDVKYIDAANQYVADLRVTYTYQSEGISSSQGSGTVTRSYHDGVVPYSRSLPPEGTLEVGRLQSNLDNVSSYISDKAQAEYEKLSKDEVRGRITVLGDETLDLRTHVNGLEVVRVTHDFSRGYLCQLDLSEPQYYRGDTVYREQTNRNLLVGVNSSLGYIHTVDYNVSRIKYLTGRLGKTKLGEDPGTSIARYSD